MFGIDRNGHGVHPHRGALARHAILKAGLLAGAVRGALGLGHVAAVAEGQAQIAVYQIGHRLRLELADVRPQLHQQVTGRRQIRRLSAARITAQIVEHHRQHFVRRVDHRDSAIGELGRQLRFEQHVEAVDRCVGHALLNLLGVVGQADGAPGVRHRSLVRMFVMAAQFLQARFDVVHCRDLRRIQRQQAAGTHQAFGHGVAGEDQIVATTTGKHFGLQGFAAFHHVVDHLDPGFGGELCQRVFGEIIRPVIQPQGLVFSVHDGNQTGQRQAQCAQQPLV
ncbi:hypothetical protein D3C81_1132860 [compost metagenome]